MEELLKILENIGFSKNEAKVYLTLNNIGSSTASTIADSSKIHRTTVYDALDRLMQKGVVSHIEKNNVKYFQASNPESLIGIVKQKQEKLKQIIPQLKLSDNLAKSKDKAMVFEGIAGIKSITEDILISCKENDKVLTFGNPKNTPDLMKNFIKIYHKRRIAKKIEQIHIYNADAKQRLEHLRSMPYTDAGYLPKEYDSPAATTVYANKVAFFIWSKPPLAILIESERMAESYRKYFKLLWSLAKK
ncbi:MAG: HTH-type sugar sensing transcriptional regulator TrmBL1 [Candidatus Woesearchaeota archaeon]|nr:HTH-type sugar sensing transcriptional regulator TrmBL1 [Candidatus Woesearchaeota archaeon]